MIKRTLIVFILCLLCASAWGQTFSFTERQFFEAIDLDNAGLEQVKKAAAANDFTKAKSAYIEYLKQRTKPVWTFDWRDRLKEKGLKGANIKEADRYANNELVSCGIWHQFGRTINWMLNPTENNYSEWTWQLNRHYAWLTLGPAYWRSGDEKYARSFVSQLSSWIDQCKRPNDNGNYPGSAWRTLEAGLRMRYTWPNAFFYFLGSPSFDDETIFKMVESFYDHALFLYANRISSQRLSHEMNGLYTVGALFPEFKDAEKWRAFAVEELYKEEEGQFYPDGSQKELTPGYHGTNLSCIVSVYELAKLNSYPLPQDYESRLESIYEYYQKVMMPDGKLPAVNDSRWVDSKDNLQTAVKLFRKREDFAYTATRGANGRKPSYTSVWMPWAGCYVMRSGWDIDAFYAYFEVGPYGISHQHEDKLSFILYAYGSRLITECGNYAYDNSQWRKYAISARGHNVARVDSMDQNRQGTKNKSEVFTASQPLDNTFISKRRYEIGEGWYTEGFGINCDQSVSHHRTLKYVNKGYWILTDEFIPSDEKDHSYDIWFHFNTEKYKVDNELKLVCSNDNTAANIAIVRIGDVHDMDIVLGQEKPEVQGWVSETVLGDGFECRPVATPIFHVKGSGVVKEQFVFIPFRKGEAIAISRIRKISSIKYRIYFENRKSLTIKL